MISKKTEIIVALMNPHEFLEYFDEDIDAIFQEIQNLSGNLNVRFNSKDITPLEIVILERNDKEIKKYFKKSSKSIIQYYLKFSAESIINTEDELKNKGDLYHSFSYFVEHFVRHLLIYMNIAKPSFFDTREGVMINSEFIDEMKTEKEIFPMLANSIDQSLFIAKEYKWPKMENLPLKETLDWLLNQWTAFETISENKLQRALNAFSYLFHDNLSWDNASDLFYSLIGIEALYVEGNRDLQRQVDVKSQLLLGTRNDFKKIFKELYDYRSRFIHGELNFINKYHVEDDSDSPTISQLLNTYDKSGFAISILIASLQKHFLKKVTEFKYELRLIE